MCETRRPTYEELEALVLQQAMEIAALRAEIDRLRKGPPFGGEAVVPASPPAFVKANRPRREKKERKKRSQSHVRRRENSTAFVVHAVERCPDCDRRLSGGSVHRTRQVIDIPVVPVQIIEHRFMSRYCGVCARSHVAKADLAGAVVGKRRIGVRLMSLIAYLAETCRMTKRTIQAYLNTMYGLHLGLGQICELLHAVAHKGQAFYDALLQQVRGSPVVHADETGWREDGVNGYVWSFSTPDTRIYVRNQSRGHAVPQSVLGDAYKGVIVSDFYGGYNYHLGEHQRCWVHLLRDLQELVEKNPDNASVKRWTGKVVKLYKKAHDFHSDKPRERARARFRFQNRLEALGKLHADTDQPQHTLAQRCVQRANELFTFVEFPEVPSENNAAERAVRPLVIARKISGGTRSEHGSDTKMVLASLFGTWAIRGQDPRQQCLTILAGQTSV